MPVLGGVLLFRQKIPPPPQIHISCKSSFTVHIRANLKGFTSFQMKISRQKNINAKQKKHFKSTGQKHKMKANYLMYLSWKEMNPWSMSNDQSVNSLCFLQWRRLVCYLSSVDDVFYLYHNTSQTRWGNHGGKKGSEDESSLILHYRKL